MTVAHADPAIELQRDNELRAATKRICVIGAGASGLAALKVIADTPQYKEGLWQPIAYEAREALGGVWYSHPPSCRYAQF